MPAPTDPTVGMGAPRVDDAGEGLVAQMEEPSWRRPKPRPHAPISIEIQCRSMDGQWSRSLAHTIKFHITFPRFTQLSLVRALKPATADIALYLRVETCARARAMFRVGDSWVARAAVCGCAISRREAAPGA